mgnify:CR=1 FL=1
MPNEANKIPAAGPKPHYAWAILISCCLMTTACIGVFGNSSGIFLQPVTDELDIGRGVFGLAMAFQAIIMGVCSPYAARLIQTKNINLLAGTAFSVFAVCFGLMSQFHHLYQFMLAGVGIGLSGSVVFFVLTPILINNWFKKKTGFALGLALAFSGIGGIIMNPLGARLIENYGWRVTYLIFAVIVAVLSLPVAFFVIKLKPADKGLSAYGEDPATAGFGSSDMGQSILAGVPKKIALKSPAFKFVLASAFFMILSSAYAYHMPAYGPSVGLTTAFGATMVSCSMASNIFCKFALGGLSDKLGVRQVATLAQAIVLGAFLILILAGGNRSANLLGALAYGFALPMTTMFMPLIVREIFGNRDYGEIYGYVVLVVSLFGAFGAAGIGFIFDITGAYTLAFIIGLFMMAAAGLFMHLAFSSGKRLQEIKNSAKDAEDLIDAYPLPPIKAWIIRISFSARPRLSAISIRSL